MKTIQLSNVDYEMLSAIAKKQRKKEKQVIEEFIKSNLIHTLMNYERTQLDNKIMHNGLIGRIFYHICPDNDKYFRTIRIAHNPFTNSLPTSN